MAITVLYERARIWWVGSDPGLLRLRMATRTTAALACSLLLLFGLTRATGQPLTVAILGAVITMIAARSVNEPDPHQQRITMALLPLPAALAITAAALLAPHKIAADVAFVLVVFTAVYIRRFDARGRALGMVAFMAYFFTLYLRASLSELPWMFGAVVVGTLCTFVMSNYVLPDRPERVLGATVRSLRARMAIVVDTTAETLRVGRLDERRQRRFRARIARLNETALMIQSQIEDKVNPSALWPGVSGEQLAPWLFDAELAVEWVAIAGQRAAVVAPDTPAGIRLELAGTLGQLAWAIRTPQPDALRRAANRAQQILDQPPYSTPTDEAGEAAVRRLALAIIAAAKATSEVRALVEQATAPQGHGVDAPPPAPDGNGPNPDPGDRPRGAGLLPTTRQAIQASVAASLAIVTGELVSQSHWYWAVIAAFVIFAGTKSWGETLTKGWQRLLGTILGVPCGVVVATLLSGHTVFSLVTIFVCLFCAFYFMQVTYSLMTFWITTMLALMYGLLGEFTYDVLLLRIEETAIGAVIGVSVAILVLPTNIRTTIREDTSAFLSTLSALIETSIATMFDDDAGSPTEEARQLDRDLQQFRVTAKPLLAGVGGFASRRNIQRAVQLFTACDRYARNLARSSEQYNQPGCPPRLSDAVTTAASHTRRSIDALVTTLGGAHGVTVVPAADSLDAAETLARQSDGDADPGPDTRRLLNALHSLRRIERAVVAAASHLGAEIGLKMPSPGLATAQVAEKTSDV